MSLHFNGEPEAIFWGGPASEVYFGSELVWAAETIAFDYLLADQAITYFNWPGEIVFVEPEGPGSIYRLDTSVLRTGAVPTIGIIRHYYVTSATSAGGGYWAYEPLVVPEGSHSFAEVMLRPGDYLEVNGSINGPGTATVTLQFAGVRIGDAEPHPPLYPVSGNFGVQFGPGFTKTAFGPVCYIQEAGAYRLTVDVPDGYPYMTAFNDPATGYYTAPLSTYPPHPPGRIRGSSQLVLAPGDSRAMGVAVSPIIGDPPAHSFTVNWSIEKL